MWAVSVAWRVLFLAFVTYLVFVALARLRVIVLPVILALLLSAILAPPVRWLRRLGLAPILATWTVFLLFLAVLTGVVVYIVPQVIAQFSDLSDAVEQTVAEVRRWLIEGPAGLSEERLDELAGRAQEELEGSRRRLLSGALTGAVLLIEMVTGIVVTLVLTFFFVKDGPKIVDWILEQVDGQAREDIREGGRRVWATLGGYIRGSTIDGLIEAAVTSVALLLIGVPLVAPIALLTFFGGYLPFVGALLAGVVAAAVALVSNGPQAALIVALVFIAIQNIEGELLQPVIMSKVIKLHPVVVLCAITAGGILGGLVGAFLAVPIVASAVNVVGYFREERSAPPEPS